MVEIPARAGIVALCGPKMEQDSGRLRALVQTQVRFVGRVARNLGVPPSDLDDVVQQVFAAAAARLDRIPPHKERAFLAQTAVRVAANTRRSRARALTREVPAADVAELPATAPSPEQISSQRQALEILDRALAAMDLDLRSVFVFYEVEQMTMAEIATTLDLPAGTVASRLRRARAFFLSHLERLGYDPGAVGIS